MACDSVRREVLYNILAECGVPINLVWLIRISLNEISSKVCIDKHFLVVFLSKRFNTR
jgi:hypothetical protein